MSIRQRFWDAWAFYDFKSTFDTQRESWSIPTWVPPIDLRRLQAYKMLDSYYRNAARFWLDTSVEDQDVHERREYGDPYLIVESIRSSVLGNNQMISVEGALENPDGAEAEQEKMLSEWSSKERHIIKINEGERDAVKYGDGVYVLGWDSKVRRPRLRVYDPGFYFPVFEDEQGDRDDWADVDMLSDDFPAKIHIAYEFKRMVGEKDHTFVRRMTWELRKVPPVKYPWNEDVVELACFMSDAEWDLENTPNVTGVNDLTIGGAANIFIDSRNLGLDFIPLIHVPNTIAENEHFGVSSLANVIQLFDDLSSTDTDLQKAAATTGFPPIGISGASSIAEGGRAYGPGTFIDVGDGKMEMLDTSRSLDALLKYRDELGEILSVNSRVPKTLLGAVDPSKVPSGIVLTLSFSPHSRMVNEMRLVRKDKYDLMLKMVSRFFMADGKLAEIFPAHLVMGSYLPADKTEAMNIVVQGLAAHALSLETSLKILTEAGFPIDDAVLELQRITETDFDAAEQMLNATGDMNLVRDRLGLPALSTDQLSLNPGGDQTTTTNPQDGVSGAPAQPGPTDNLFSL